MTNQMPLRHQLGWRMERFDVTVLVRAFLFFYVSKQEPFHAVSEFLAAFFSLQDLGDQKIVLQ